MRPFSYHRATDVDDAVHVLAGTGAVALGGGTNLVDLMRQDVEHPETVVDMSGLGLTEVAERPDGGVRIGASVRNSHLAAHRVVRTRDTSAPCNKRDPGSGCGALAGLHRDAAVLGTSEHCIATHPSDMAVALTALDAIVEVRSVRGTRSVPLTELHRLPGETPQRDTTLEADELIVAVELPAPATTRSAYRKVRDRASFAFALVSVAAALEVRDDTVTVVRVALGGVAHKPWRAVDAERVLTGAPATEETFRAAAEVELAPAFGRADNAFKIELARRTIVATLAGLLTERGTR